MKEVDDCTVQLDQPVKDKTKQELISMKAKVLASVTASGLGLCCLPWAFEGGSWRTHLWHSILPQAPAFGKTLGSLDLSPDRLLFSHSIALHT